MQAEVQRQTGRVTVTKEPRIVLETLKVSKPSVTAKIKAAADVLQSIDAEDFFEAMRMRSRRTQSQCGLYRMLEDCKYQLSELIQAMEES